MDVTDLLSLLERAAITRPERGLILHEFGIERRLSYDALLQKSRSNSRLLQCAPGFRRQSPVIIYLEDHADTLIWFWTVLQAGAIPVILPSLSHVPEQRRGYINYLHTLFDRPIWIVGPRHRDQFEDVCGVYPLTPAEIKSWHDSSTTVDDAVMTCPAYDGDAMLMLTSGSTGHPKAVRLNHKQVLAAVHGKLSVREHSVHQPFLNWIGLDHVASITEIHLTAMCLGVDQVHVPASEIISDAMLFLDLIDRYQVSRTFAPNFFLSKLASDVQQKQNQTRCDGFNFSHLTWLGSGGEANETEVCRIVQTFLSDHHCRADVMVPGFGMTETCAGSIYHLSCPSHDSKLKTTFTSVGKCMPGIRFRISKLGSGGEEQDDLEIGDLEVSGPVVFSGYYNNSSATSEAFTEDGWFRTGDKAAVDETGNLYLLGRAKDTIIINGVKYVPADIENTLNQVLKKSLSRLVCFRVESTSSRSEQMCILFVPMSSMYDLNNIGQTHDKIVQTVMLHCGIRPIVISLADSSSLQVSSLGKVSRKKIQTHYAQGHFDKHARLHEEMIRGYRLQHDDVESSSDDETALLHEIKQVLNISEDTIGPNTHLFHAGMTSLDMIRLKKHLESYLSIAIPLSTLLAHPTARSLNRAIKAPTKDVEYEPVVKLRREGEKTPLWLVHPGVGEVLVFLGLSQQIDDRPVYALRARGFEGQQHFRSIKETVDTYLDAIKKTQPHGPYAIAGYSYGAMLAFEISKRLESDGSEVRFLGSFNLPPNIKHRMRQLNWNQCLLHLCFFLDLISETNAHKVLAELEQSASQGNQQVFDHVLKIIDSQRLNTLGIDQAGLHSWADLAYQMQNMAVDYEPGGAVGAIDVFHAEPLRSAADSRADWIDKHLSQWAKFCRSEPRFHEVGGAHYTMLKEEYVEHFGRILQQAMKARGI